MSESHRKRLDADLSEACCDRCNQTFTPADTSDLVHFMRRDGELCGGTGVFFRKYVIRNDPNRW